MNRKITFLVGVLLLIILISSSLPASASSQQQTYYNTPTADANNRIYYIVKKGDTCTSIYLLTGVLVDQLRLLNDLDKNCTVMEGQKLLLGIVTNVSPTPALTPTPTSLFPSATPYKGNAQVCVDLYNDVNGNGMMDEGENSLADGAVSISDALAQYSKTGKTTGNTPVCFTDVPEGSYTISIAIPDGYNATTQASHALDVKAGDQALIDFGAQTKGEVVVVPTPVTSSKPSSSSMLGILGGLVLVAGIALGIYAWLISRRREPF